MKITDRARADYSKASSLGSENKEARSLLIKDKSGDARAIERKMQTDLEDLKLLQTT